jgi:HK97 family phage major capsid protein
MGATQTELRLANRIDERELVRGKHEAKLAEIEAREDKDLTPSDREQLTALREKAAELDAEIKDLADAAKAHNDSIEESRTLRRILAGGMDGVNVEDGEVVYRDFSSYARDVILTRTGHVTAAIQQRVSKEEVEAAAQRLQMLKRTPANTLSSNVAGLIPDQHIAQIFQVIDNSRPIVQSAQRAALERGVLSYPRVDTPPVVAVQSSEKTEAGNTGMAISMQSATASTYLGGGDLSWQAINWSTPNALDLWFRLTAADYALKTEQDAAQVLQHSAFSNNISSTLAASSTFAQWMTAIGAGYSEVFANSGRTANTLYIAADLFGYLLGLTSNAFTQFTQVSGSNIGPLNIVVSRGMDAGVAVVGDSEGLLVAETPGAPVELRVVEPAIGGVEVGLIGAFEAVVVDDGAFAMITTAS